MLLRTYPHLINFYIILLSDRFLFPSLYEGLGIVTIESQCSGCQTVTSTNVPAITKVTDKITYLSLDEKSEVWANTVINQNKVKNRISYINEIQSAGYDICKEVKNLEEFYLNINERSN